MPDFGLDDREVAAIAAYLMSSSSADLASFDPGSPGSSALQRTESLVSTRLSCLGCHAIDGRGGRIGPDLTHAAARLWPEWIRAMLDDPGHLAPGSIMPAMPGTDAARDRVAAWLILREPAVTGAPQDAIGDRAGYLSVLDAIEPAAAPPAPDPAAARGARLHAAWCAACHGNDGGSAGYNAAFLAVAPADHTDARALSARPDDTLHDAIAAGAFFLGKSAAMPGFASRLQPDEIRDLVHWIRVLCACEQPAWAADGRSETRTAATAR